MAMISRARFGYLRSGILLFLALTGLLGPAMAAETNAVADTEGKSAEATVIGTQESLRSYLQIQEQLHNTQLAIEKNRQEAAAAAASNSEVLEGRLSRMEKALASQRLDELKDIEHSGRMILIAAGAFTAVGFLVLITAAFLQWTAVSRLAAAKAKLPPGRGLQSVGLDENQLLSSHAVEESATRFLGIIERLEQRIHDMETSALSRKHLLENGVSNGESLSLVAQSNGDIRPAAAPDKGSSVTLLLGKGQTLLKLDKPEAALGCLDEVLMLDPRNTDALIRKGAALERLQRLDEAIDCYDRAIAQDNTMTMAYLYKGAVFNRLERYSEALECYEQALKTRQKGQAANVIFE